MENLSRKQKRFNERRNEEANEVYKSLTSKFLEFFIYADASEEQKIVDKMDEISKKWRLYCERKSLSPNVYKMIDEYMEGVVKQYAEMNKKEEKKTESLRFDRIEDGEKIFEKI